MPARRRYVVTLTAAERTQLRGIVQTGREQAFRRRRAHILLQVDAGGLGAPAAGTWRQPSCGNCTRSR